jgi:hypothetical protein
MSFDESVREASIVLARHLIAWMSVGMLVALGCAAPPPAATENPLAVELCSRTDPAGSAAMVEQLDQLRFTADTAPLAGRLELTIATLQELDLPADSEVALGRDQAVEHLSAGRPVIDDPETGTAAAHQRAQTLRALAPLICPNA